MQIKIIIKKIFPIYIFWITDANAIFRPKSEGEQSIRFLSSRWFRRYWQYWQRGYEKTAGFARMWQLQPVAIASPNANSRRAHRKNWIVLPPPARSLSSVTTPRCSCLCRRLSLSILPRRQRIPVCRNSTVSTRRTTNAISAFRERISESRRNLHYLIWLENNL